MWKQKVHKLLALLLAVLLLSQAAAFQTVAFAAESDATPELKDGETVIIPANATKEETADILYGALVVNKDEVSADGLDWQYECQGKTILGTWGNRSFGSIDGFETQTGSLIKTTYTHPALSENANGSYRVKLNGMDESSAVTICKYDKNPSSITLKENVTVGLKYNDDLSINYADLYEAIWKEVVEATTPDELTLADVTITYVSEKLKIHVPLEGNSIYPGVNIGDYTIHISFDGNDTYAATSAETTVSFTDSRLVSTVVFKEGASITYNMDPEVMKQDLFDNAIDWDASILPDTLCVEDLTMEYASGEAFGVTIWTPIEGNSITSQMGAGEQQVRISYRGNAEYRPVTAENSLTVNKATVKVTVNSTSIYPDESVPEGFVTLDPNDPAIDIYTIYAGLTSSAEACVYVQLPARLTDSAALKILDPIVAAFSDGKTLTEMMQEGMTVGELRELLSGLVDALNTAAENPIGSAALAGLGIDAEALSQLLTLMDKLPGIADDIRVCFGTPNKAGVYTVIAVTSNKNYETAYGMGVLLVKVRVAGVKLVWNQSISKLTVEDAAVADFGATVTYNGEPVADQSNVHYLYSGVTSSLKPYSSTTTAPTEPGRYVVTVVTLGGNYQAAPLTRSFQITK